MSTLIKKIHPECKIDYFVILYCCLKNLTFLRYLTLRFENLTNCDFLCYVTFTFWNCYVLKLLRLETTSSASPYRAYRTLHSSELYRTDMMNAGMPMPIYIGHEVGASYGQYLYNRVESEKCSDGQN
jgi:hypothetical protein